MAHVAQYKKDVVKEFTKLIKEYPIVGAVNMEGMPTPQLQNMRASLRDICVIKMSKRRLIKLAIEQGKKEKKGIEELEQYLRGMPALLFTKENPFKLFKTLNKSKSPAPAKAGQTAPNNIVVSAGPTSFAPGPVIGELGALGIKTGVENGKIVIKQDATVCKEGEKISAPLAGMLTRLGIEPMEIGLDLVAVYENGTIYTKSILSIDEDEFLNKINDAARWALNLSVEAAYTTKENIELLISKSFRDSKAIALEANILADLVVKDVLAKAERQMLSLKDVAGIQVEAKPKVEGEKKEPEPKKKNKINAPPAPKKNNNKNSEKINKEVKKETKDIVPESKEEPKMDAPPTPEEVEEEEKAVEKSKIEVPPAPEETEEVPAPEPVIEEKLDIDVPQEETEDTIPAIEKEEMVIEAPPAPEETKKVPAPEPVIEEGTAKPGEEDQKGMVIEEPKIGEAEEPTEKDIKEIVEEIEPDEIPESTVKEEMPEESKVAEDVPSPPSIEELKEEIKEKKIEHIKEEVSEIRKEIREEIKHPKKDEIKKITKEVKEVIKEIKDLENDVPIAKELSKRGKQTEEIKKESEQVENLFEQLKKRGTLRGVGTTEKKYKKVLKTDNNLTPQEIIDHARNKISAKKGSEKIPTAHELLEKRRKALKK